MEAILGPVQEEDRLNIVFKVLARVTLCGILTGEGDLRTRTEADGEKITFSTFFHLERIEAEPLEHIPVYKIHRISYVPQTLVIVVHRQAALVDIARRVDDQRV